MFGYAMPHAKCLQNTPVYKFQPTNMTNTKNDVIFPLARKLCISIDLKVFFCKAKKL